MKAVRMAQIEVKAIVKETLRKQFDSFFRNWSRNILKGNQDERKQAQHELTGITMFCTSLEAFTEHEEQAIKECIKGETAMNDKEQKIVSGKPEAPDGYKVNPLFIEKRTKRIQLIMQPSVYNAAKAKAKKHGESFNEYVHKIIIKDINSEK